LSKEREKRGGLRANAGRPSTLSLWEKIAVGSAAQNLSRGHAHKNAYRKAARVITDEIRDNWALAASIPIEDRRAWRESFEGEASAEDIEMALLEATRVGILQEDPATALQEADVAPRVFSEVIKTPYGKRSQICAIVAKCATKRFERQISPRMVDRCWKLLRAKILD
jgi:hypothetical protein